MITVDMTLAERYRLDERIGRGGMAEVYRAHDLVLERPVAVKVVRGAGEEDARRFAAEIRAMAALNHPNIVRLFDAGTHDDAPFLVMELIEGPTLPSVLADGPIDRQRASSLGRGLAEGLAHAHELGVVHRDVKPGNVLIDTDEQPRLSDFGIARLTDATRLTGAGMTTGTAGYLAPEQLTDTAVGPPADIYALGLVLLECLTGKREFTGTPVEASMARLNRSPEVPDDLPTGWRNLLQTMTTRDPDQRPTAAEVAARLRSVNDIAEEPEAGSADDTIALAQRGAADDTATAGTPEDEGSRDPSPAPAGPEHPARGRLVTTAAVVVLLGAALVLALLGGLGGGEPDAPPPEEEATDVPGELEDALQRLEEAVSP